MRGTHLLFSFVFAAACSSGPATVDWNPPAAPAPIGEVAAARSTTDAEVSSRYFDRTPSVEHRWSDHGHTFRVSFELGFSAPLGRQDIAATSLLVNWDVAVPLARRICEQSDLTTRPGLIACEDRLCRELSAALFDHGNGKLVGRIERVVWNSVRWN